MIRVSPKQTAILLNSGKTGHRDTGKEFEGKGRDWNDAATSQAMPSCGQHQKGRRQA